MSKDSRSAAEEGRLSTPYYDKLPPETVIVGGWESTCNNCGKQTVNFEVHDKVSGYGGGEEGCGVEFKFVSASYGEAHREGAQEKNPSLTYVPIL
jgi:hypothetical protein